MELRGRTGRDRTLSIGGGLGQAASQGLEMLAQFVPPSNVIQSIGGLAVLKQDQSG